MAELALAITGVVLAWKGIMDFGDLMWKMTKDDTRDREGLWIRLQVSQFWLKDWNSTWGVDTTDGRFRNFEPDRKELIMKIIFRLHDSRTEALSRLKDRYGVTAIDEESRQYEGRGGRLTKLIARFKDAPKKVKEKSTWMAHDREMISLLIKETVELQESLQYLTNGSGSFIAESTPNIQVASSLHAGLRQLEHRGRSFTQRFQRSLTSPSGSPTLFEGSQMDEQTLASFATKTIGSSRQAEYTHRQIEQAFHFHGDDRIPDIVSLWWNAHWPGLLILETVDIPDDSTATFTCSLVYYLVSCDKLIFSFQRESLETPLEQLYNMLKTFILSMVSIFERRSQPFLHGISGIEDRPIDTATMQKLVDMFKQILLDLSSTPNSHILIIIDRLDICEFHEDMSHIHQLRSFFQTLQAICEQNEESNKAFVKVFVGCKGHAMILYDSVNTESIVDITSLPNGSTNLMQELAVKLNDTGTEGN